MNSSYKIKKWSLNRIHKFLVMLLTVSALSTSVGISREVWRITLDNPPSNVNSTIIKVAPDGAIYRFIDWSGGSTGEWINYNNLIRITPEGEIDWEINWQTPIHIADSPEMYVDFQGNVYVTGRNTLQGGGSVLRKYSPSGDLLFDNLYPEGTGYDEPNFTIQNINKKGDITFIGGLNYQIGNCVTTLGWMGGGSNSGNRTWSREIGERGSSVDRVDLYLRGNDDNGGSLIYYIENKLNCLGDDCREIPGCVWEIDSIIAKIDGSGNLQWKIEVSGNNYENYYLRSSGYVYRRSDDGTQLSRINTSSVEDWTINLPGPISRILENEKDNSVLIISSPVLYVLNKHLMYVNSNGGIRWERELKLSDAFIGSDGDVYYRDNSNIIRQISSNTGEVTDSLTVLSEEMFQCIDSKGAVYVRSGYNTFAKYVFGDYLTIRDAHNDTIPNTKFELFKVANDPPYFTEEYLGKFTTDDEGRLEYKTKEDTMFFELDEGKKYVFDGDMIKVAKLLHSETAPRHSTTLPTMYSVYLDNIKFDEQGIVSFNKVGEEDWTEIILDHTELQYNLVVSIEWDADQEYQIGLQKDFRGMSNYLYDVTDGQVRLDQIKIFDNKYTVHVHANFYNAFMIKIYS